MPVLFDVGLLRALSAFRHLRRPQPIQRDRVCVPKPLLPGLVEELQEVENEEELRGLREDGQAESNPFAEFLAEDAA